MSILNEKRLSVAQLARQQNVNPSTIWRWIQRGIGGVKLEAIQVGGRRYTSAEAFQRFVAATTAAANGEQPKIRTNRQREAAIKRAERELDRAGI